MLLQIRPQVADEFEGANQPIGVSGYEFAKLLPDDLKSSLPTIEEIEQEPEVANDKLQENVTALTGMTAWSASKSCRH